MNNKRSGFRGFGVYLILVLAVIAIWYWLDGNNVTNTYTRQQFETATKTKLKRVFSRIECMQISGAFLRCRGICHSQHTDTPFPPNL